MATITVETPDGAVREIDCEAGRVLRDVLIEHGLSPHSRLAVANCGGRGLCATCGVRLETPPDAEHWHDRLADRFGYPRLSCQIEIVDGMCVRIPEKRVWGRRE
ncbi:2Fe-2S iron-sulfur cluster-binding protein [Halomicrobium sp. LC1Hm]|uniref:2Fe-2S iron-sulfur cluster-binding protein n=1 Tax=Halomicrobium sp. LC1Hm TaxID=2610902 RepID=UPI0012983722|nr:2Fe-2S iron-sulfur cluster-binding protein [Halomicrobium sp. LC1Hm]QGA81131.1 Ferredoxin [Halomicrobium sp. LC1Hm]